MDMILISGYGLTAASWGPLLAIWGEPAPAARAVELPGHGSSTHTVDEDPLTWTEGLDRALADADGPVVVVAFSMGTAVLAHHLAASGAQGIAGVVLLGGLPGPETFSRDYHSIAAGVLTGRPDADAALVELYAASPTARSLIAADLQRLPLPARRAAADLAQSPPVTLRVPTLAIFGADDRMTPPPTRERLAGLAPNSQLSMVSGAGHAVHLDAPETVVTTIRRWLEQNGF
ncbi:alpha/beta fold hydrolase [Kineosporia succinea]|uniref:Pimeloyl-ACP methyl ester carboxylesterase n=1 Tax=Kineosporia succinea TaxID=84632 RepID=A0ABT9PE92_9ACTN|nr:alpha/beta hydrolase [Kineosporia succinea]MDP9831019.1 pimeloyl-ACP methyl ester carboxylesterase [Kineosporia succinea]